MIWSKTLLDMLKEIKDIFAWIYVEMPRLYPQLVTYQVKIKEGTRPVKQTLRNLGLELEVQIKQEIKNCRVLALLSLLSTRPGWLILFL